MVKTQNGLLLRRNRRHLIHTAEDSPVISTPFMDDTSEAPLTTAVSQTVPQTEPNCRTRSGRAIRQPVRFQDYVVTVQ